MNKESMGRASASPMASRTNIIKKYANRRLYDTNTSTYITLENLCDMVKRGEDFTVIDAKTEEDLTRQVLTQIIFEQESKGYSLLPVKFLRSIISFYGGKMQQILPPYLEASMDSFVKNQDKMREYVSRTLPFSPFTQLEEIGKQNMALFQRAFSMFSPFEYHAKEEAGNEEPVKKAANSKKA